MKVTLQFIKRFLSSKTKMIFNTSLLISGITGIGAFEFQTPAQSFIVKTSKSALVNKYQFNKQSLGLKTTSFIYCEKDGVKHPVSLDCLRIRIVRSRWEHEWVKYYTAKMAADRLREELEAIKKRIADFDSAFKKIEEEYRESLDDLKSGLTETAVTEMNWD